MILYRYSIFIGILFSILMCIGVKRKNKKLIVLSAMLPTFFASPFFTVTRGAAGAITASDITGFTLLLCIFFLPKEWRSVRKPFQIKILKILFLLMGISIWTSGLIHNFSGIDSSQIQNLRISSGMMTPFLIAGFRTVKLLTLAAYGIFFYSVHFTDEDTYFFFNLLVFGGIILAIAQTLTSFGIMDLSLYYGDTDGRYIGPRILGHTKANIGRIFFMGIIVCMVLMRESKLRSLISICILTTGLVFTGSRAGIGALLVGFISICFLGRLRGVFMGGIFFIIILLFGLWALTYNDLMAERLLGTFGSHSLETGSQRFPIWEKTLSVWLTSPLLILFGVGAFNFSYANFHIPLNFEHAHNDLLTLGTELGFLSIVLFLAWIFLLLSALISKTLKSKDKERWHWVCMFAITVGLLFASQFEATFYPTISTLPFSRILYPFLFIILQRSYNTKSFLLKEEIS